jgi:hypothetical protein
LAAKIIPLGHFLHIHNETPHVTILVNRDAGAKPVESNKITQWHSDRAFALPAKVEICD